MRKLKKSQKLRIIVDSTVSLFTTVNQVREGLGCHASLNDAVRKTLTMMESIRSGNEDVTGYGCESNGLGIQINMV